MKPPESEAATRKDKGSRSWPSVVGAWTRGGGLGPAYWIIPLAIALLIAVVGMVGYGVIKRELEGDIAGRLETLRDASEESLRTWIDAETALARMFAARPEVAEAADSLVGAAETATVEQLRVAAPGATLAKSFTAESGRVGFSGFAILDAIGRIVASSDPRQVGTRLPPLQAAMLGDVIDGRTRLLPPYRKRLAEGAIDAGGVSGEAVWLAATPIRTSGARTRAILALEIPTDHGFSRILGVARQGDTAETYVFDQEGRLLSESRFDHRHLAAAGLIPEGSASALHIHVRDPGGNLFDGYASAPPVKARPLTRAAASAVGGGVGVDVAGYRDYRGVPVVGAWKWLDELDLGIVTEVDVAEAFRSLGYVNFAFWALFGAAALAGILLSVGSWLMGRLNRTVRDVKQLGQYTLIQEIGEGAMGRVFRASHAMLRRPTAIKLLKSRDAAAVERFEREVQLTSELSHPNTIAIYDFGRTPDGIFYYAMEYLDGINLGELIKIDGPVAPARIIHILRQICGSLSEAHARGLVHRDIKPSNIVLSNRGGEPDVVKVLDFGLVKHVSGGRTLMTTMGVVFGTPGFIPPETLKDPGTFDARGDIYAMGVVAYELLTGQAVFEQTTVYETCRRHIEDTPVSPSERLGRPAPPILSAVIMACLAKDASARPQTTGELREMLDSCEDVGPWTRADAAEWWEAHEKEVAALRPEPLPPTVRRGRTIPIDLGRHAPRQSELGAD